jgi:hypothetical protein
MTAPQSWRVGDRVNWCTTIGGYALPIKVAGIVRKLGTRRVTIEVAQRIDGVWRKVKRSVDPDKLIERTKLVPELDDPLI